MKQWKTGPALIKFWAIFSVVGVHFILNAMEGSLVFGTMAKVYYFGYLQFFIICVPLFLLTTGYLNLYKQPTGKYYRKLLPILGIYLFYSLAALLFRHWYLGEIFSGQDVLHQILSFEAVPYAWYVKMFIGLFLLTPFLNKLIHSLAQKELDLLLGTLILLTLLPLTFNYLAPELLGEEGILLADFWTGLYPITYYVAGARLRLYPVQTSSWKPLVTALAAGILAVSQAVSTSGSGELSRLTFDYGNLFTFIQSLAVFVLLIEIRSKRLNENRLLQFVSRHTLHIYLASFISDQLIYGWLGPELLRFSYRNFRFAPLFVVLSFALAMVIVFLLQQIKQLLAWRPASSTEKAS